MTRNHRKPLLKHLWRDVPYAPDIATEIIKMEMI